MYTDPSGYLSSADITAGTIIQANLINTGMSVYLTVLHKLYAASNVDVEEFKTISGGDWAWSMFESTFGAGFFINNLILCLAMTNIVGACVMIGVVSTVMCMLFTIAAADAALDGNDALEQYYGMMTVLSLAGAFFGFDQAMKEAGITADQLAVAKENASVVTDSNVDINNTNVPPASGGSRGTGSSVGKGGTSNKNVFPDIPDDLLPEIQRNTVVKSNGTISQIIYPSDNIRIRTEQHPLLSGETYNPRHHRVHYHVEYKKDFSKSWNNRNNVVKVHPKDYTSGSGTGFIPGEEFPR